MKLPDRAASRLLPLRQRLAHGVNPVSATAELGCSLAWAIAVVDPAVQAATGALGSGRSGLAPSVVEVEIDLKPLAGVAGMMRLNVLLEPGEAGPAAPATVRLTVLSDYPWLSLRQQRYAGAGSQQVRQVRQGVVARVRDGIVAAAVRDPTARPA